MTDDLQIGQQVMAAVDLYNQKLPRSQQRALGVSDVGGCREYARLVTIDAPPTDARSYWPATIGTAIDAFVKQALLDQYGDLVDTGVEVNVRYPGGAVLPGHPDAVFAVANSVMDLKTKDGVMQVARKGPSVQEKIQVNSYAAGLLQAGVLKDTPKVHIVYLDRSGGTDTYTWTDDYDPAYLDRASEWIEDVKYAVKHSEEASKDKPYDFCERYCEFFTSCRKPDWDPEGLLQDPEVVDAADMYLEGHRLHLEGQKMKLEAKGRLGGVNGSTGRVVVRTTWINATEVDSFVRDGYNRLDVRAIKK
jgi:hypothetical protein